MPFTMKVSNEAVEGKDVVPAGQYELKLLGFKPTKSKKGDSINLNPKFEIVNHGEHSGRKVYDVLNSGGAWVYPDFCHAFGVPMETDGKDSWLPVIWDTDKAKFKEDDPATWVASSPLIGKIAKVELAVDSYNGRDNNKIRRYFCAVPDCEKKFPKIKHSTDLLRKGSN